MNDFVLGVDLDGVCADYEEGFRRFVATELNRSPEDLPPITHWGYDEWGLNDDDFIELHSKAVTQHMHRHLPIIEGCTDALWRLSDAGIWIRVITHRLYTNWSHEAVVSDTVAWLDQHKIPYRDLCFLGAKPQIEADLYIDDAPHNIKGLSEAGNEVIVFDQLYNRELPHRRASSWEEVEELVTELAAKKVGIQTQIPGIDAGAERLSRKKSN